MLMILFFFLLLITIGFIVGKNVSTVKDYSVAGKNIGTFQLSITKAASSVGAGLTIGAIVSFYNDGILFCGLFIGTIIAYIFFNKYIAKKIDHRFKNMISMGDMIKYHFGIKVEKFSALILFISSIAILTAQFTALGHIISEFLLIDYNYAVIGSCIIITIYSSFGGIRSILATDILQFFIFIIVLPILTIIIIKNYGLSNIIKNTPNFYIENTKLVIENIILFIISSIPRITPVNCHRYLMAKDHEQIIIINKVYLWIIFLIMICTMVIAFASYSIDNKPFNPNTILLLHAKTLLPMWFYSIVVIALLAIITSTADSFLNTQTINFVHNLLLQKKVSDKFELFLMKITAFISGIFVIFFAIQKYDIITILVLARSFLQAWTSIPLVIALIIGFKKASFIYWIGFICSIFGYLIAKIYFSDIRYMDSFLVMLFSFIGFFTATIFKHYRVK